MYIYVTLNEGQGQYNQHVMHSGVWGRHHAKLDDDDFNSFWVIACQGHTHTDPPPTHTHTPTHRHGLGFTLKFALQAKTEQFFCGLASSEVNDIDTMILILW